MVKVRKITGRGTGIRIVDEGSAKWAGDAYREEQKKKLSKVGKNITVHTGRGTGSKKLNEMPDPKPRPSTKGMTRITNRGTGSRKSTNKGSN